MNVEVLDGDVVRTHLSKGLGFSRRIGDTNILRIGWVCQVLTKHGSVGDRGRGVPLSGKQERGAAMVEKAAGSRAFVEVWVRCAVEECIKRDVKGMYAKALRGEIEQFTGCPTPMRSPRCGSCRGYERRNLLPSVSRILGFQSCRPRRGHSDDSPYKSRPVVIRASSGSCFRRCSKPFSECASWFRSPPLP